MPSLVDLVPELQLKIIDELLRDASKENGEDAAKEKEEDPYDMNPEKPDENEERKERERQNYRVGVLMNWSCTSEFFRNLLAPYIFRTVDLRNNNHSGSSATALSKGKHSKHVRELNYVGTAPGDAHRDEEEYSDTEAILPESVGKLLSDLSCFPNLDTLSVEFPYHFADLDEWDSGLDLCADEEPDDAVKTLEEQIAWRALMAKTYDAVIQNKDHNLKALEIRQLGPKKVSTFNTTAFHEFLSRLERFSLSIYGEDNGAGWNINKHEQYSAIMSKLGIYFFDHLNSVTDFVLKAPEEGPLGLEGMSHVPLALNKAQMPSLRTLHLRYVFVGQELIDFLIGHTKTLESLSMRHCSASVNGLAENGIHWNTFFDALHDAKFEKLRYLSITPDRVPLTSEECYKEEEDKSKVANEVKEIRQILENDPDQRLFSYVSLDDKYGMIFDDEEENVEAFRRGEDQASYERLMGKIKANAEKSGER